MGCLFAEVPPGGEAPSERRHVGKCCNTLTPWLEMYVAATLLSVGYQLVPGDFRADWKLSFYSLVLPGSVKEAGTKCGTLGKRFTLEIRIVIFKVFLFSHHCENVVEGSFELLILLSPSPTSIPNYPCWELSPRFCVIRKTL